MLFFIEHNGRQVGPLKIEELSLRGLTADTRVWHEGMEEWQPARLVPELAPLLGMSVEPESAYAPTAGTPTDASPVQSRVSPYAPPGYEPTEAELAAERHSDEPQAPSTPPEFSSQTQQPQQQVVVDGNATAAKCPKSWLVPCLLVTILLVNIIGIVGIIFAARVQPYFECGAYDKALKASNNARNWFFITLGVGIVIAIIAIALCVFVFSMMGIAEANGALESI